MNLKLWPGHYHLTRGGLTLKAPRKNESGNNCLTLLTNLNIEANRVDPDQIAPIGAV